MQGNHTAKNARYSTDFGRGTEKVLDPQACQHILERPEEIQEEEFMRTKILLGLAILWPLASWAADPFDVKLGLWETSISGMPAMPAMPQIPESALANMSQQQRAQVEAMMKGRGGAGAPLTARSCVTRESRDAGALGYTDKDCTSKVVNSSSSKQVLHMECKHGNVVSEGDVTIERTDSEHITGTVVMKTNVGGQSNESKMTFSNKWISADCGNVKPVMPAGK